MTAIAARPFDILLVEDDPADAGLTRRALCRDAIACRISHVRDGGEALAYLRRQPPFAAAGRPDLVLLDLNMPGMDGRQVLETIKNDKELKMIPVVVLTTSDMDRDVNASYLLGANSVIAKPMDMDTFCAAVRNMKAYWFNVVRLPR